MNDRTSFIGAWVSKQEKEEIVKLAKGMNISVSDLIRHRVMLPSMTLPEAIQNLRLHIDSKFKKVEYKITELLKEQLFDRVPIRRTYIEEYRPIEQLNQPPTPIIENITEKLQMREVIIELKKIIQGEREFSLQPVPEEEIERKRPKTDQVAFITFKSKKK